MTKLIVDASVVIASLLPDEPYRDPALQLLSQFLLDDLKLLTVPLLKYEVTNAVWKALKIGRIKPSDAEETLREFEVMNIPENQVSCIETLKIAYLYDRSTYDSAYLALAQAQKASLVTADKRLYNALKGKFDYLLWVEDF